MFIYFVQCELDFICIKAIFAILPLADIICSLSSPLLTCLYSTPFELLAEPSDLHTF